MPPRLAPLLTPDFFARDALAVARALLGQELWHGDVGVRITETEAYRHPRDSANHCRFGKTARNAPMWGPAGHAYVYLCYGMHAMLNLVTDGEGEGAAVLIRAAEPIAGLDLIRARRRGLSGPTLLTGPAKVAAALGVDTSFSGRFVCAPGGLEARAGSVAARVLVGPRVGIDYASARDRKAAWRFAVAESPWVSHRRGLRPERPARRDGMGAVAR